jgi:hypothetical protein
MLVSEVREAVCADALAGALRSRVALVEEMDR